MQEKYVRKYILSYYAGESYFMIQAGVAVVPFPVLGIPPARDSGIPPAREKPLPRGEGQGVCAVGRPARNREDTTRRRGAVGLRPRHYVVASRPTRLRALPTAEHAAFGVRGHNGSAYRISSYTKCRRQLIENC